MAALVAYRNYLINNIGMTNNNNAMRIIDAGLDDFQTMPDYKTEDVKKMVTALRKGTGQMPDPLNPGAFVNATPMTVSPIVEKRLSYACTLAKFYQIMSRTIDADTLNRARITNFGDYFEMMKELKLQDVPALEPVGQKKKKIFTE